MRVIDIKRHLEAHQSEYETSFFNDLFDYEGMNMHPKALLDAGCHEAGEYTIEQRVGTLIEMACRGYNLTRFVGWYLYTWNDYEYHRERYQYVWDTLTNEYLPEYSRSGSGYIGFLLYLAQTNGISIPKRLKKFENYPEKRLEAVRDLDPDSEEERDKMVKIFKKIEQKENLFEATEHFDLIVKTLAKSPKGGEILLDLINNHSLF